MLTADLVLNRHYLILPIYRLAMSIIFVGIFLGTVFLQVRAWCSSHYTVGQGLLYPFQQSMCVRLMNLSKGVDNYEGSKEGSLRVLVTCASACQG